VIDVAIAGGGLVGLSVAWRAAQRALSVTVVDEAPGSGASRAAAGMLAPVTEAAYGEEALLRLCLTSLQRYPDFVAELNAAAGTDVIVRGAGTLLVGFDDDMRAVDELHRFQLELGLEARRLTGREARRGAANRRSPRACAAGCSSPATTRSTRAPCTPPCCAPSSDPGCR
jgi:glycine oxidase